MDPESLLEHEQPQELNGLITTIVSAPYSKELEEAFYIGSKDIDDHNIFWTYKVDKQTKENNNIILNGTYSLFDDLKAYGIIRDKRPSNINAATALGVILEGSRWQVGNVTSTHVGTANWYYISRLEAFWEFLENWNVEFKPRMTFSNGKITGRYIDIVDKLSDDYGKWYEYGDSLLTVTAEQASNALYTAFIGRGKGEEVGDGYGRRLGIEDVVWSVADGDPVDKPAGQDYVEIPSATELYGYSDGQPRTTVVTFEDTETPELLIQQTYDYALNECRPKLQLKSEVLEDGLSELGETCTIIRDDIGIRYKTRVFKITRDFLNKKKRTVEFGDEIVQSAAKRNSNTAKAIKKQEKQTIYWLDDLRQRVVDSYFNEDGYNYDLTADNEYDLPAGYYSFDRPIDASPTKVVYMGAGKILIANSKNPDGQWDWTTAIDGDGANLDAVNTGVMQAGRIQSAVDGSYWDLDNGLLNLKSGIITGKRMNLNLGEGIYISTAEDGSQTYIQNGIIGTRNPNNATIGQLGYIDDIGKPTYVLRTTWGSHFKIRSVTDGSGGFRDSFKILSGGSEIHMDAPVTYVNGRLDPYGGVNMNSNLQMNNQEMLNSGVITFNFGGQIYSHSDSSLYIAASTDMQIWARGTRAMLVSGTHVLMTRTLSMENNDITNQSDQRLKNIIGESDFDALQLFRDIRPTEFTWKNKERFGQQTEVGFIAQELKELDPTLVTQTPDDNLEDGIAWSINETQLNRKSWIATHQLVNKVDSLEKENTKLKEQIRKINEHIGLT